MTLKFVIINKNGNLKDSVMRNNNVDLLYRKCGFKNNNNFKKQHTWTVKLNNENVFISVYAKVNGRALNENKYELPPPIDKILYFGDIALVCSNKENKTLDFNVESWNTIYYELMGGFENIELTEDESETEEEYSDSELTNHGYLKDGFVVEDEELLHEEYEYE